MSKLSAAVAFLLALPLVGLCTDPGVAQSPTAESCWTLADLRIEDTNLLSAAVVPASGDLPEYCRVLGYVRPAINFEIRLPTADWNGRFYMAGCGVFCGRLSSDSDFVLDIRRPLQRGYAVSMTDAGHWGESGSDARWAYHNRLAEVDFGYRAVHETARVTKSIIGAFYGRAPIHSYFGGCSTGGRQANMSALRYPEDFDGIISGAPDLSLSKFSLYAAWLGRMNQGPEGKNLITGAEARLVERAVYEACDPLDGLEDGLIEDPRACALDLEVFACGGREGAECLSAEQIAALRAFYDGPRNSAGDPLYGEGAPFGSEPFWRMWISGRLTQESPEPDDDFLPVVAVEFLRYMAFPEDPGESYMLADFHFDRDPPRLAYMARIYDSDSPDLEAFRAAGGKLLMWHGWADAVVPPLGSIQYYESVENRVGSQEAAQELLRLFMLPGMDHCGIGEGPGITHTGFDPLTALERWVEHGEAPASLLTTKTDSAGRVLWTRPVCPYPQRAVYDGEGNVKDVNSFACTDP